MARDTRDRMLATTARLLQRRGYHGTSLNDVLAESGAPRGSLYFHFPGGKDELVIEATRATIAETTAYLRELLGSGVSPARAVRSFVDEVARLMAASDYTFGCPVAPVILDDVGGSDELETLCREALEEWIGQFREAFVRAGIPGKRAESLALLVESSVEGLLLIARACRDIAPMTTVAGELETIVAAATPGRADARE